MGSKKKKQFHSYKWINKYTIIATGFVVWIAFFDQYSLVNQYQINKTVKKLENEKLDYETKFAEALKQKEVIEKDPERFAREEHFMHKKGEKIYLVERK